MEIWFRLIYLLGAFSILVSIKLYNTYKTIIHLITKQLIISVTLQTH